MDTPGSESPLRSPLCDSRREELASSMTHAAGVVLSVAALVAMLWVAGGEVVRTIAALVFGVSLVMLYLSSTLYHWVSSPRWKHFYQWLDHVCIYLLIAGSYTPLALVSLRGAWGWSLLAMIWLLAIAGVLVKSLSKGRRDHWISTALYVLMGWLALTVIGPMLRALPLAGVLWLVAGGLSYTLGVVFFLWRRLPYHHAIWHLFVLGGSACHVAAALFHILPVGARGI